MTKTFQMTDDQVDQLIVDELKDAWERNLELNRDEGGCYMDPDWNLIEALETVIGYFMPLSEFDRWQQTAALRKLTVTSELMGGYDVDKGKPKQAR